jgi:hypothetical protein
MKLPISPHDAAKLLGSLGGKQRAKNLSPKQRREIAKQGALARWGSRVKPKLR